MKVYDKLIFEISKPGRRGYQLPADKFDTDGFAEIPGALLRQTPAALPEVSELDVVRHYTNLSAKNFGVDTGFYPLGSCTMKYNPKINEELAAMPEFAGLHPLQDPRSAQGALELYWNLQRALSSLAGLAEFTLNPYAGAHGELTGLMVMRSYHMQRGDLKRTKVIVPDTAHGTNPASAMVAGLEVVEVKSKPNGSIDVEDLRPLLDDTVAGIMMTNPNTLGMFETEIMEIAALVHEAGGLLYYDGANFNPLLGKVRPGDMGFDIMHINLHKTFSTPHGGGGPGAGPVGVAAHLTHLLPNPKVVRRDDGTFDIETSGECLGRVSTFFGNFGVLMKAYAYILSLGRDEIGKVGPMATLNANYIKESLRDLYKLPIEGHCKHEFVFDGLADKSTGVTTLNVAKRLLDFGFHAPTIYFPLLFHESMMIEPTESESLETLDEFIDVMRRVAHEAAETPDVVKNAPMTTIISHPDETGAAKNPILTYRDMLSAAN
ncbi:MAG: aminomethyl-transferring glycine dehydrogenase subunit GcvPB [Bacteroidales bacterium]|nr:aminomethyl-transferring glycine dehydrogenase subunit GcvPB [Bacteroidales bacterium]